jgi:hypothetical protein
VTETAATWQATTPAQSAAAVAAHTATAAAGVSEEAKAAAVAAPITAHTAAAVAGVSGEAHVAFPCLEALLLGQCQISSWQDVDQLDLFSRLVELRLSGNPLVVEGHGGRRYEVRVYLTHDY